MKPLLALALAWAGFAALALAMDRHHRQVLHGLPPPRQRLLLRAAGALGLAGSLLACVAHAGWSTGAVLWLGLLPVAAVPVALALVYAPSVLAPHLWWRALRRPGRARGTRET